MQKNCLDINQSPIIRPIGLHLLVWVPQACSKQMETLVNGECHNDDYKKVLECAKTQDEWQEDKSNDECIKDANNKEYMIKNCLKSAGFTVTDKK